jgi:SAM-dependent methyltransferase
MNAWDGRTNVSAYDEVEAMANYATQSELEAYRRERLDKYEPYVCLFRALGTPTGGLRVVDVGSGSSAFLYALERADVLQSGLAIERSATRHEFAERWRQDEGFHRVTNVRANFADVQLEPAAYDRISVIDETYLYLRPQDDAYPAVLLAAARDALAPGGTLVMDFRNDEPLVANMAPRGREFTVDLPTTNAFASASYRQLPSADRRLLRNESTYLARDGTTREKVEITEVCDVPALAGRLSDAGFAAVTVYGDLTRAPFDAASSPRAVIVAQR